MADLLKELLDRLDLEPLEKHLFRGQSQDLGWGAVYGGQVLAQAMWAASKTVDVKRPLHSFHGYFLRMGDPNRPIIYDVDTIRDGRSFTTRRVVAIQGGKAIFNMSASFQEEEPGFSHQSDMPDVTQPEDLLPEHEAATHIDEELAAHLPQAMVKRAFIEKPIEIRVVERSNPLKPEVREPVSHVWFKANGAVPEEAGGTLHRMLLAYASDFYLMVTSLNPHGVSWLTPGLQVASLDHAMWFHRPFRMDEWLLYAVDSPNASGARGLSRGQIFTRDGELVASTAQEGLIRQRKKTERLGP
ncbi:MAG: acyl-CoA thioesterase II [Deltaproteobacteria bacterium]|nr:acyl-CoA thioesterase II [Deltaproteobacteria bacterium]